MIRLGALRAGRRAVAGPTAGVALAQPLATASTTAKQSKPKAAPKTDQPASSASTTPPAPNTRPLSASAALSKTSKRLTRFDVPHGSDREKQLSPLIPRSRYTHYPLPALLRTTEHPSCATMSARDFIHNSLYNPHYGYFSKHARIFQVTQPVEFTKLPSTLEFMNTVGDQYAQVEAKLARDVDDVTRQIWHTPTELFKPYFGYAVAKHVLDAYRAEGNTGAPLVVYEVGGGNGTLMANILDYLQQHAPEVYATARYSIVEISASLAAIQRETAKRHGHAAKVDIINTSILDDASPVCTDPCFVIAMEVVDNLAHDVVRADLATGAPLSAVVTTDQFHDHTEEYAPVTDPTLARALYLHAVADHPLPRFNHPIHDPWGTCAARLPLGRTLVPKIPFAPNLSQRAFVPTMHVRFAEQIAKRFPLHKLVLADFSTLPDTIDARAMNAPVVQTRFKGSMVPVGTYLVQPGFFDVFFPTEFAAAQRVHDLVRVEGYDVDEVTDRAWRYIAALGSGDERKAREVVAEQPRGEARAKVLSQRAFLQRNADLKATTTKSGENPLLMYYENCAFLVS
ncbi:hypothetical protein AMAG_06749 [Allomyces macrogynus ATCC 38327]|uniref:Protein arginine methyltransferase NDUFAF7 n=1 Tax=Allomyces macrogynus (strain ATCC 38327) TaxID=578462 RepID=A0A0L0SF42_ALLM3|nr:hypothetical protein AMAG_06749 [Allomyces macrogynus ATCC 38327]|eukprot:KNE60985.1 hypothetical protein AMAG_06749 [Allomyces macrogynus ATCC 38327]